MTTHRKVVLMVPAFLVAAALLAIAPRADGRERPIGRSVADEMTRSSDSTLPRDPALKIGTLPNGMRYYVRVNKSPAKRAMLRLVVNAGSILESDDQQGFAHFLEHMAFNGTTHFPKHGLIDFLEHSGMRFGADINAQTSFDETVFMLEVPTDDAKSLGTGLTMLQDWADGGMLIDSSEVIAERGVVLGEWRSHLVDTMTERTGRHGDSVLYGASKYLSRSPIGLATRIETAQPEPIKRFYKDWYRPDLMAIVAVGDFDPKAVEREIIARFGKIAPVANARPRISPSPAPSTEPIVDVYRDMVSPGVLVLWRATPQPVATTSAVRQQMVEQLLFDAMQQRFLAMRSQAFRPFVGADAGHVSVMRSSDAYALQVVAWPDSLEGGLAAALAELERVAQHGVPQAQLERQKSTLVRKLEGDVDAEGARSSGRYASEYSAHYLQGDGSLLESAAQRLSLARALLPTITSTDLARAAAFWHRRSDMVVQYNQFQWAHNRAPTRESILALFDSVAHLDLAADSARIGADAPLMSSRPQPGRVTAEKRDATSGVTEWTLSNGARVLFKPTKFDADELLIDARSPGGTSLLPDTLFFSPGRLVAQMMTQAAGLDTRNKSSLQQQLISTGVLRDFEVSLTPTEEGVRLGGSPKDLETLFQLLYLQFTAPKLDTASLALWKRVGDLQGSYSAADDIAQMLSNGNRRLAPPSPALIALADTGRALAVYRDRFGNAGNFTFTIVGRSTPSQVRPLVERYIASLPSTGKKEEAADLGVRAWKGLVSRTSPVLPVDRASTTLFFEGEFPTAPDQYLVERQRLDALAWTLRLKFTDLLREQMGGTYGTNVTVQTYALPQEHYSVAINFDAAPERMSGMLDTLFLALDTVRARGASPDELQRIAAMQRRAHETALADNRYWLKTIELYDRLKIPFGRIVASGAAALTADDVKLAAQRYLPSDAYIHITAMPQDSTLYTHVDSTSHAPADSAGLAPRIGREISSRHPYYSRGAILHFWPLAKQPH